MHLRIEYVLRRPAALYVSKVYVAAGGKLILNEVFEFADINKLLPPPLAAHGQR